MKKRICFIAQFPPPIHGLSKAVDTLYNSELKDLFEFEKVNITDNRKIIKNLITIIKSNADLFYFTISQTKGGNLRDLVILKLLEKRHKRCLIHLHGGYYRTLIDKELPKWQKNANYKLIKNIDGAIVLGESLKYIFKDMIDEDRIFIVPNCVDDEFVIDDEKFDKKIEKMKNKKIRNVLYLSNFIKTKGYLEVLKLAKMEKQRCDGGEEKKLHFDFAGKFFDENEKRTFFDFIEKNNLREFVTYHGIVKGQEKKNILLNSDFFILLTKYPNEGQPISIIEAMANGMVIITTNHAGIPDIVKNNENGILENEVDCKKIFNEILRIDSEFYKKIVHNNRKKFKEKFTQKKYIENIKKIFLR